MSNTVLHSEYKGRRLEDDMTIEELELFNCLDMDTWGDAADAAARGALYLDRIMPDWYTKVTILSLDLSSACSCVLGQLFGDEAARLREAWYSTDNVSSVVAGDVSYDTGEVINDGFGFGLRLLDLSGNLGAPVDRDGDRLSAADFFGFDHYPLASYEDLTEAWAEQIETRKAAADA